VGAAHAVPIRSLSEETENGSLSIAMLLLAPQREQ